MLTYVYQDTDKMFIVSFCGLGKKTTRLETTQMSINIINAQ